MFANEQNWPAHQHMLIQVALSKREAIPPRQRLCVQVGDWFYLLTQAHDLTTLLPKLL